MRLWLAPFAAYSDVSGSPKFVKEFSILRFKRTSPIPPPLSEDSSSESSESEIELLMSFKSLFPSQNRTCCLEALNLMMLTKSYHYIATHPLWRSGLPGFLHHQHPSGIGQAFLQFKKTWVLMLGAKKFDCLTIGLVL